MWTTGTVFILLCVFTVGLAAPNTTPRDIELLVEEQEGQSNETECPAPFINISDRCLFVNPIEEGTFSQIENLCVMLHGHLVKIESGLFLSEIVEYIQDSGLNANYWIGGSDTDNEGEWTWRDGSPVPMGTPFWGYYPQEPVVQQPTYDPAANCLCIMDYLLYFFMDCNCYNEFSPICEYDINEGLAVNGIQLINDGV